MPLSVFPGRHPSAAYLDWMLCAAVQMRALCRALLPRRNYKRRSSNNNRMCCRCCCAAWSAAPATTSFRHQHIDRSLVPDRRTGTLSSSKQSGTSRSVRLPSARERALCWPADGCVTVRSAAARFLVRRSPAACTLIRAASDRTSLENVLNAKLYSSCHASSQQHRPSEACWPSLAISCRGANHAIVSAMIQCGTNVGQHFSAELLRHRSGANLCRYQLGSNPGITPIENRLPVSGVAFALQQP